jgi:hypothetical protein
VQEFTHTHIYDLSLVERLDLDIELPTVIQSIGWGKLYDEPCSTIRSCTGGWEGIRRIESRMDEFKRMQTEIHVPINSQTSMLHHLFDHFGIDLGS